MFSVLLQRAVTFSSLSKLAHISTVHKVDSSVVLKYQLKGKKPEEWPSDWPNDWSIVYSPDSTVNIVPQPAELKIMSDGTLAVPFVADAELPLQQEQIQGIQLKRTNGTNGAIRELENLPNPSVASVLPDDPAGKVYSEMYVYV